MMAPTIESSTNSTEDKGLYLPSIYVNHASLGFDIKLIMETAKAAITQHGAF